MNILIYSNWDTFKGMSVSDPGQLIKKLKEGLDNEDSFETIKSKIFESLIKNFQVDIRRWVEESIQGEISEIQSKQSGRSATHSRDEKIQKKKERLERIKNILCAR